jgi:hypothetical protein
MQVGELLRERADHARREEEGIALKSARFLPEGVIAQCSTFREAVWLAWENRASRAVTKQRLAEACDVYPSRLTQYVNSIAVDANGKPRPDLPAEKIPAFEAAVGNRALSQWLNRRARLTIMEEMIAARS